MALVASGYRLIIDAADNGGKPYTTRTYDLVDADPTTVEAVATSIVTKFKAVSDSVVAGYTLGIRYIEDAFTLPAAGVQNENQAIMTCPIVGDPFDSATVTIPAPKITLFTNTSGKGANIVNSSFGALQTYLGIFDPTAGNEAYISDGEQIVAAAASGKRRHTKNSNG
jgi:hypothetical protein